MACKLCMRTAYDGRSKPMKFFFVIFGIYQKCGKNRLLYARMHLQKACWIYNFSMQIALWEVDAHLMFFFIFVFFSGPRPRVGSWGGAAKACPTSAVSSQWSGTKPRTPRAFGLFIAEETRIIVWYFTNVLELDLAGVETDHHTKIFVHQCDGTVFNQWGLNPRTLPLQIEHC